MAASYRCCSIAQTKQSERIKAFEQYGVRRKLEIRTVIQLIFLFLIIGMDFGIDLCPESF